MTPTEPNTANRRRPPTRIVVLGAAVAVAGLGLGGVAAAGGDDGETETPIVGDALEQASSAALTATGGGQVTETEAGDEDSAYEVEVALDDGRSVDVQLDASFKVVSVEADGGADDPDSGDDGDD